MAIEPTEGNFVFSGNKKKQAIGLFLNDITE
jgi:hypothetical protein